MNSTALVKMTPLALTLGHLMAPQPTFAELSQTFYGVEEDNADT